MKRILPLCVLLVVAGCGAAPTDETSQSIIHLPPCAPGGFGVGYGAEVTTSAANPWGTRTGVVVGSDAASDGTFTIYGVDTSSSGAAGIVWFMLNANDNDLFNFESYPQSERFCGKVVGDGSAGASPQLPPDPWFDGICVPNDIYTTATSWYVWGPSDLGNSYLCKQYSSGGCVPKSCAQISGCGMQPDGCYNSYEYCRPCPCPCGQAPNGLCFLCLK